MSDQATAAPVGLRERVTPRPQEVISRAAVMTRMADAMHRLERLADQMERAADEGERQLALIKTKL